MGPRRKTVGILFGGRHFTDELHVSMCVQSLTLVTFGPGALSVCPQNSEKNPQNSATFRKESAQFRKNPQKSAKIRKNPQKIRKNPQNFRKNPQNPKTLRAPLAKGTPVSL